MLCEARRLGVSVRQLAKVRLADLDCGLTQSASWINALSAMYERRRHGVYMNHTHLCLVADASVHSIGDDCLLSIAYVWDETDEGSASYADFQHIKPTKGTQLGADEIDMYDEIAALIAEGKEERCATYRQIQATSHTIYSLTQNKYNIDSYVLPSDVMVPHQNIQSSGRCCRYRKSSRAQTLTST